MRLEQRAVGETERDETRKETEHRRAQKTLKSRLESWDVSPWRACDSHARQLQRSPREARDPSGNGGDHVAPTNKLSLT